MTKLTANIALLGLLMILLIAAVPFVLALLRTAAQLAIGV